MSSLERSAGMTRSILVATFLVFVLGGVAAAGRPVAAVAARPLAKTAKACGLLTTREATKVLGVKMNAGKPHTLKRQSGVSSDRCDWESTKIGAGGVAGKRLVFNVATFTGKHARLYFEGQRDENAAAGFPYEPVPNLGTDAYFQDKLNTLSVLASGTQTLIVRIDRTTLDTSKVDLNVRQVLVAADELLLPRLEKS